MTAVFKHVQTRLRTVELGHQFAKGFPESHEVGEEDDAFIIGQSATAILAETVPLGYQHTWLHNTWGSPLEKPLLVMVMKTPLDDWRQLIINPLLGLFLHFHHLFMQRLQSCQAFFHRLKNVSTNQGTEHPKPNPCSWNGKPQLQ